MQNLDLLKEDKALYKQLKFDILNLTKSEDIKNDVLRITDFLVEHLTYMNSLNQDFINKSEYINRYSEIFCLLVEEVLKNRLNFRRVLSVGLDFIKYLHTNANFVYNGGIWWVTETVFKFYENMYGLETLDKTLLKYLYFPHLFLSHPICWGNSPDSTYEAVRNFEKLAQITSFNIYSQEDLIEIGIYKDKSISQVLNINPQYVLLSILNFNSFCVEKSVLFEDENIYKLWSDPLFCLCCKINMIKLEGDCESENKQLLTLYGPQETQDYWEDKYTRNDAYWDAGGGNDWSDPTQF